MGENAPVGRIREPSSDAVREAWVAAPCAATVPEPLPAGPFFGSAGSVAWPSSQATFTYQPKGSDTLTIGDARCWIEGKSRRALMDGLRAARFIESDALEYATLLTLVEGPCAPPAPAWARLDERYAIDDTRRVHAFLSAHPELVEVLLDAALVLDEYFGAEADVALEVVADPEAEGGEELVVQVGTSAPVDEAMDRLSRMDREWFLDQLGRVGGLLNINLVFV